MYARVKWCIHILILIVDVAPPTEDMDKDGFKETERERTKVHSNHPVNLMIRRCYRFSDTYFGRYGYDALLFACQYSPIVLSPLRPNS